MKYAKNNLFSQVVHFASILVTSYSKNALFSFWRPHRRAWWAVSVCGIQLWPCWRGVYVSPAASRALGTLGCLLSLLPKCYPAHPAPGAKGRPLESLQSSAGTFSGAESQNTAPSMGYGWRAGSLIWTCNWKAERLLAGTPCSCVKQSDLACPSPLPVCNNLLYN